MRLSMEEVQVYKENAHKDMCDGVENRYEELLLKRIAAMADTIEAQQQEIKGLEQQLKNRLHYVEEGNNCIRLLTQKNEQLQEQTASMREALSEAISNTIHGRLCSIGGFQNTYSAQISTSAVERWERALLDDAGKDYHNPADMEALKLTREALASIHDLLNEREPAWYLVKHDKLAIRALTSIDKALGGEQE